MMIMIIIMIMIMMMTMIFTNKKKQQGNKRLGNKLKSTSRSLNSNSNHLIYGLCFQHEYFDAVEIRIKLISDKL